jgi:ATP-dependent Clp protease ATP-binding subunit ClpA
MFERYTERARRVIFFARYEASQFGSTIIETEHLLLGLVREDKNLTNRFLRSSSSIEWLRKEIEGRSTIREKVSTSIDLPLSPECKRILAHANEEAERLNNRHIGTEHLLLGILREEKCMAAEVLAARGLRLQAIREELARSPIPIEPGGSSSYSPLPYGQSIVLMLGSRGFTNTQDHLRKATEALSAEDLATTRAELQLVLQSLVDAFHERNPQSEVLAPLFEGFDWRMSLDSIRTGLSEEEDCRFKFQLTLLLAELLLERSRNS